MVNRGKIEPQFNRVRISEKDFQEAEQFLSVYRARYSTPVRQALLVAAIVAYARPFGSNSPGGKNQSTASIVGNAENILLIPEQFSLHKKVLELRNQAIAHSDYDRNPIRRVMGTGTGFVNWFRPFDVLNQGLNVRGFRAISRIMKRHCITALSKLNIRLRE